MVSPIKNYNYSTFINDFKTVYGQSIFGGKYYVDSEHSLGFGDSAANTNIYIGSNALNKNSNISAETVRYFFSKSKSCLYVDIRSAMNSGGFSTYSAVAAKASNGKWIVFYTSYYGGESNPFSSTNSKTLYYNTPTLDYMSSDIVPSAGADGYPYIIHPCSDFSGGSLSDLFFIDHMPKFDSQNPPVITSGKSVFVIPPYPNRYANTAAFAIEIDPADY